MSRVGFRWTMWSTPPVTCTIVVTCWALTFLVAAGVAALLGISDGARIAWALAKACLAGGATLLGVAGLTGIAISRRDAAQARAVERPVER